MNKINRDLGRVRKHSYVLASYFIQIILVYYHLTSISCSENILQFTNGKISVILSRVNLFSSGVYSCEVSADIPDYDTEIRRQHLHVFGK